MRVFSAILASGPARKALGLLQAAVKIGLFLLKFRHAGERAERLSKSEKSREVQRQMLDAASRRAADRDALVERLRD